MGSEVKEKKCIVIDEDCRILREGLGTLLSSHPEATSLESQGTARPPFGV